VRRLDIHRVFGQECLGEQRQRHGAHRAGRADDEKPRRPVTQKTSDRKASVSEWLTASAMIFGSMIDWMTKLITEYVTTTLTISLGLPCSRANSAGGTSRLTNRRLGM